jgi:hypothetical protein
MHGSGDAQPGVSLCRTPAASIHHLLPVRIRLRTTPCQGFPVRVRSASAFIHAAIRSNPKPSARVEDHGGQAPVRRPLSGCRLGKRGVIYP